MRHLSSVVPLDGTKDDGTKDGSSLRYAVFSSIASKS